MGTYCLCLCQYGRHGSQDLLFEGRKKKQHAKPALQDVTWNASEIGFQSGKIPLWIKPIQFGVQANVFHRSIVFSVSWQVSYCSLALQISGLSTMKTLQIAWRSLRYRGKMRDWIGYTKTWHLYKKKATGQSQTCCDLSPPQPGVELQILRWQILACLQAARSEPGCLQHLLNLVCTGDKINTCCCRQHMTKKNI